MEDPHVEEEEERGSAVSPPPGSPCLQVPMRPSETVMENHAVSMANNDCSPAASSPAEATPARPAVTSPTNTNGITETSPTTSDIASASDSLTSTGTRIVNTSAVFLPPLLPVSRFVPPSDPAPEKRFPAQLTFKGVSVTLENDSVWKQFHSCVTEMILTKQGRRMFPSCCFRLAGLEPTRQYNLVLSIVPADQHKYRWHAAKWEVCGPAEHQAQDLIRAIPHHYSPCSGAEWMSMVVSFYKLKLTNNTHDQDGHIILHSLHRYIPRLHVIPVPDRGGPTRDRPVVKGPESMTFTFLQTEFVTVTSYQNIRITQLKINHNPFAKSLRADGHKFLVNRSRWEAGGNADAPPPGGSDTSSGDVGDSSTKKPPSVSDEQEAESHAKQRAGATKSTPITEEGADVVNGDGGHPHTTSVRGNPSKRLSPDSQRAATPEPCPALLPEGPLLEPNAVGVVTPQAPRSITVAPKPRPGATPPFSRSVRASSPVCPQKRRRINRRWGNSRGREDNAEAAATAIVVHSPSLTVAMQPELDDVEGLLFVSFTSKEALGIHVGEKRVKSSTPLSPLSQTPQSQPEQTVAEVRETDEEKIARLQAVLLQDIRVLKHRQVIHRVLQEVGLKLSSLDPLMAVDLRYLGVHLPLPSPVLPEQNGATRPSEDEGSSFVSRTGKTKDMTKIKGWREKFIQSREAASKRDGSQKDLSAFCSNMLDEYLESEAQQISERAAAFSTNAGGSVAYQLPAKSSSYVKTLDSVLKHRTVTALANRPCPLSHKRLYSVLTSPTPPARSRQQLGSPQTKSKPKSLSAKAAVGSKVTHGDSSTSQGSPKYNPWLSQKQGQLCGQNPGAAHYRPPGLSKFQLKLTEMETGAVNQGLSRTLLTTDRLSVALSVILTAKMLPSQRLSVPQHRKVPGPECGQEFCRLGCVCSSLSRLNRGPLHCRRPDCMFGCACFKRKITKQNAAGEAEHHIQRVYSVTNMEHEVQPSPGSHSDTLWNRSAADLEPLFIPKAADWSPSPSPPPTRRSLPRPVEPMREEDKDPVYKYLESMMTCARVREFNNKTLPDVTAPFKIPAARTSSAKEKPPKTLNERLKKTPSTALTLTNAAGKTSMLTIHKPSEPSKRLEIQSACQWDKDRKMVLDALYRRMKQDNLLQLFRIGPYLIRLVSKTHIRKISGSTMTYKVHISKPKNSSDDEDKSDDSDEEESDSGSEEEREAVEEDSPAEQAEIPVGVTPFLSGVLPAGRLSARTKPSGRQADGLIQVNGKSYTQARLLLGKMGSLHPANRLAAYVTGRLCALTKTPPPHSQKPESKHQICAPGAQRLKAAGAIVPPVMAARKVTVKTTPQEPPPPPGQRVVPPATPSSQLSQDTFSPFIRFGPHGSITSSQSSLPPSSISLTVSPSLRPPSFLGHNGTYSFRILPPGSQGSGGPGSALLLGQNGAHSFRICPPDSQGSRGPGQNPPGVTLPGGFTLIQLPQHGADGAFVQPAEIANATNTTGVAQSAASSIKAGPGLASDRTPTGSKDLEPGVRPAEPGSSPELTCDEKMPSDESDDAEDNKQMRQVESDLDMGSEDMSSDSSDYDGEEDGDDETVDIETVEDTRQKLIIAKLKAAASSDHRYSSEDSGSAREHATKTESTESNGRRRQNHKVLERLRRSEQRFLISRLQKTLRIDPRAPKLRVLAMAQREIQSLGESSKRLEEEKRRLNQMQAVYVKHISHLCGKPQEVIRMKLRDIYQRKKLLAAQTMLPLSSHLRHQFNPTVLKLRLPSHPEVPVALTQAPITTHQPRPTPRGVTLRLVLSPAQATEPQSQVEEQPQAPVASGLNQPKIKDEPEDPPQVTAPQVTAPQVTAPQVTAPHSQTEVKFQAPLAVAPPQVTTPQSQMEDQLQGPSAPSPAPQVFMPQPDFFPQAAIRSPQPMTLPLIRSKTGRIILPSSLKPVGQGYYTLMVMGAKGAKKEGEESEVGSSPQTLPSDLEISKDQETISSESEQPVDSSEEGKTKTCHVPEEAKTSSTHASRTAKSSNAAARRHALTSPLVELARLNKSIFLPPAALVDNHLEGSRLLGLDTATACLSFKPLSPSYVEPELSPPIVHRGRGRPRKHAAQPDAPKRIRLVEETKAEDSQCKVEVESNPAPVKRRRGRPPKKKRAQSESPAGGTPRGRKKATPVGGSPEPPDSPVRFPRSVKSSDTTASRPLTRGALGKDFPSAKKRSWIDIEKELEPE